MYINLHTIDYSYNAHGGRVPKSGVSKHFSHLKEVRLFPKI